MNIIYKCKENQFKEVTTRYCTDKEGNELSASTVQYHFFASNWFWQDILLDGVCDIPTTSNAIIDDKPKICVTGFEPECYDNVMKYPPSQCSLRTGQTIFKSCLLQVFSFNSFDPIKEPKLSAAVLITTMFHTQTIK